MSALEGAASLRFPALVSVEERRNRPYFRNTKNFGGDMSYQFQSLVVEASLLAGTAALTQKGDI
jgi:electron transfer flavoprotein alpha/beta subunit